MTPWVVVVHCGAGWHALRHRGEYKRTLRAACLAAAKILVNTNGDDIIPSLCATENALVVLEDSEITNAGHGSSLNEDGSIQMDCSIMDGNTGRFGAIGAINKISNPARIARRLLEESSIKLALGRVPPVFLVGDGANRYALASLLEKQIDPNSLVTPATRSIFHSHCSRYIAEEKRLSFEQQGNKKKQKLSEHPADPPLVLHGTKEEKITTSTSLGTVGCICMDSGGKIAAGTSSGGISLKKSHRVGQAAVFGSGCWADDRCGVSTSGAGEDIIKYLLASECARTLRSSDDPRIGLHKLLEHYLNFPNALTSLPCPKEDNHAQVGFISLLFTPKCESSPPFIEINWAHTTPTFAVAYFTSNCSTPTVLFSEGTFEAKPCVGGSFCFEKEEQK